MFGSFHSDTPNLIDEGGTLFAACDIQIGEEITWDYRPWGGVFFWKTRRQIDYLTGSIFTNEA